MIILTARLEIMNQTAIYEKNKFYTILSYQNNTLIFVYFQKKGKIKGSNNKRLDALNNCNMRKWKKNKSKNCV